MIKDIFLIYKDGRQIKHMTNEFDPTRDSQVLSSMFSAIQSFAADSLKKGLRSMVLEDGQNVCLEKGENAYLVVVSAPKTDAQGIAYDLMRQIESKYDRQLQGWDGDTGNFSGLDTILNKAFNPKYTLVFADWPAMPAE